MDIKTFKKTFHFSDDATIPLYMQLAAYIRGQIQAGILKPGDQMIPENDLCEVLNVSRTTVRQSMKRLVEEGLLVRYRGKGSFIASEKMRRNMNYLYDFTSDMIQLGVTPTSIVLEAQVMEQLSEEVITSLQLMNDRSRVFYLNRLRCANGDPILWEHTYIPYDLCDGIEQYSFERVSLYHTLSERYFLNLYHAVETLEAVVLNVDEAKVLKCPAHTAGYRIRRISTLDTGQIFEMTTSITRADRCLFQFDLYKNKPGNKNPVEIQRRVTLGNQP